MEALLKWKTQALLIGLLLFSYLLNLGQLELRAEEPRRAIISIEMMQQQDLLHPTLMGEDYYNKPPLFNWLQLCFFRISGSSNEFTSRLPGILSILILALILFQVTNQYFDRTTTILSCFIFLSFADLLFYGLVNSGEIDLFFAMLVFAQLSVLFKGYEKNNLPLAFIGSYALMTLAFLTKGLPAVSFQFLTLIGMIIYTKKWKWLLSKFHGLGILLSGGILLTFFYAFNQASGEGLCYLSNMLNEAGQRSGAGFDINKIMNNVLLFPPNLLKLVLPWSIVLLFVLVPKNQQNLLTNNWVRFSLIVLLVNLPLYWFTGEIRNRYLYPLFPFIAVIFSYMISGIKTTKSLKWVYSGILLLISMALIFFFLTGLFQFGPYSNILMLIFGVLFLLGAIYIYAKNQHAGVTFIASLFVLKIFYSALIIPAIQNDTDIKYRDIVKEMTEKTRNVPIYYYGEPTSLSGSLFSNNCELNTAPIIPYQIPYYHYQFTNKVMVSVSEAALPGYYLCRAHDYNDEGSIIMRFGDNQRMGYILFELIN